MRTILCIILLSCCLVLCADGQNAFPLMQLTPSAISRALGGDYIGVADVWHSHPSIAWCNPAMPASHEGIAIGFIQDQPWDNAFNEDSENGYYSGTMTISYNGIGILLPSVNPDGKQGLYYYYNSIQTNGTGKAIEENSYSFMANRYGLSCDVLHLLRNSNYLLSAANKWLDVSVGIGGTKAEDDDLYLIYATPYRVKNSTFIYDLGLLAHATYAIADNVILENSLGYKCYNLSDEKVNMGYYDEETYSLSVGNENVYGAGAAISLKKEIVESNYPLKNWTENLATLRILMARNYSSLMCETFATGVEMGLADTFFMRYGSVKQVLSGNPPDYSWGFGVNLHNKDWWALEFNLSREDLRYGIEIMDSWDAMFQVDGIKLYQTLVKN